MGSDFTDWYKSIPKITRWWFSLSVVFPLLGRFGLLNAKYMILYWEWFFHKFQIWRPFTALVYYPITPQTGFHFLINLYFLYTYSSRLETGLFDGRPADYMFMLIFQWCALVIVGFLADLYLLMDPMVLAVLYVWCQLNRDTIVSFWFGTQFKAMYLPWVLFLFNLILRGGGFTEFVGILVGHLYFFLAFKYPQDFGGPLLVRTPQLLYRWLPNRSGAIHGFTGAVRENRVNPAQDRPGGHNWGQGRNLGD